MQPMKRIQRAARRRSMKAAELILQGNTVRVVADMLGMSKTQIHKDVTYDMKEWNPTVYCMVQEALRDNKRNGYVKSGEALRAMANYRSDCDSACQLIIRDRAVKCAKLIIEEALTVREVAERLGMSKTTVHLDVAKRLRKWYPEMADLVAVQLAANLETGRVEGGYKSTKRGSK